MENGMKQLGFVLGGAIRNFQQARRTKQQTEAETLERLAIRAGLDPATAATLALNLVTTPRADEEPFIMLTASQNAAVVRWLRQHSARPQAAIALWAELFTAVHPTTGEIMLTRAELAERVAIDAKHVSSIMTELAGINAITRQRTGRRMRYFMNPSVATHIPGTDARKAARDAAGPLLTLMEGGKT